MGIILKTSIDPARQELIDKALPATTLIRQRLYPEIKARMFPVIADLIRQELEVYRAYPRKDPIPKEAKKTFDPTHNTTCFMGKGFNHNDSITDHELANYREAIGTVNHPVWGDCTLLEIWAGDHFVKYPNMVKAAFSYAAGERTTRPPIKVYVNPLFTNKDTGDRKLTPEEKQHKKDMDELLAKAMVFGVREPKRRR